MILIFRFFFNILIFIFFFLFNLIIIIIIKICQTHGFNPTHVGRVGLDLCDGLGWVGLNFFFDPPWWVGSKNPINPTHAHPYSTSPNEIKTQASLGREQGSSFISNIENKRSCYKFPINPMVSKTNSKKEKNFSSTKFGNN